MIVNKDIFENKWEQIRAQTKEWWSLMSDDDLKKVEKAPIKFDKYVTMPGEIWLYLGARKGGNQ